MSIISFLLRVVNTILSKEINFGNQNISVNFSIEERRLGPLTTNASPFISYEFLGAEKLIVLKERGQLPFYFTLWEEESLRACYYLFLKGHSYGEYIFDWACRCFSKVRSSILP